MRLILPSQIIAIRYVKRGGLPVQGDTDADGHRLTYDIMRDGWTQWIEVEADDPRLDTFVLKAVAGLER